MCQNIRVFYYYDLQTAQNRNLNMPLLESSDVWNLTNMESLDDMSRGVIVPHHLNSRALPDEGPRKINIITSKTCFQKVPYYIKKYHLTNKKAVSIFQQCAIRKTNIEKH